MYIYNNKDTGKLEVKVPVVFQGFGRVEMEFDSIDDMNKKLKDSNFVDKMSLPTDWDYIEDSYQIDFEGLDEEWELSK